MSNWSGGLVEWTNGNTVYLSIAFTWRIPEAYSRAVWYRQTGKKVRAGGPALFLKSLQKTMQTVSELGGNVNALPHHNPNATIASRGCPVGCSFCIVPKMEGKEFTLLPDFTPRPILCDNNLSALPIKYQSYIIEKYKSYNVPLLDANSGFEPRTFDENTYTRWKEINKGPWRMAFDETKEENDVVRMAKILENEPPNKKRVYVLIGNEPFEECYRRIQKVISLKCEPFAQPMMALNTLVKRPMIRYDWTEQKLRNLARWTNRWIWRTVPFKEYKA